MSGLCGWTGVDDDNRPPAQTLAAMAGSLLRVAAQSELSAADPGAALCISSWAEDRHFNADRDLFVALQGYPIWSSARFADIAARNGHGAALAAAFRDSGADLLSHLQGEFSLAVVERSGRNALLAVDRLGTRPMSFAHLPDKGLVFGSSADAVRAHAAVSATVPPQAIFDFLNFSVIPAPRTVYREQRKLLAGQFLSYRDGEIDVRHYWHPRYRGNGRARPDELGGRLHELLRAGVRRSLDGEDPSHTGAFLSGGLDSTTVCGLLGEIGGAPAKSFTIGFRDEGYDEMPYARIAARHFKLDHHEYYLSPKDAAALLPELAVAYDEPFGNSSAIPAYYCARVARDAGVGLLLAGDGGDEIFAGNARYVEQLLYELPARLPRFLREHVIVPVVDGLPCADRVRFFRRLRNFIARAQIPLPDRLHVHHVFHDTPVAEIFEPDFLAEIDGEESMAPLRESYMRAETDSVLQAMLYFDLQVTLADNDLRKVTRMCELAGVRVKFPLLDEQLVDFAAGVPPSLLIRGRKLRHFYKSAMTGFLPNQILDKPKHGFGMPFDNWLRDDPAMRRLAADHVLAFGKRGIFRPPFLDRVLAAHRNKSAETAGDLMWDIVMLEMWLQAR